MVAWCWWKREKRTLYEWTEVVVYGEELSRDEGKLVGKQIRKRKWIDVD